MLEMFKPNFEFIPKFKAWIFEENKMVDAISISLDRKFICFEEDFEEYSRFRTLPFEDIELLQYTNRLDKNKKEIYAGDIIKLDRRCIKNIYKGYDYGYVQFNKYWSGFDIYIPEKDMCIELDLSYEKYFEIVGNIFENEEVLNNEN